MFRMLIGPSKASHPKPKADNSVFVTLAAAVAAATGNWMLMSKSKGSVAAGTVAIDTGVVDAVRSVLEVGLRDSLS